MDLENIEEDPAGVSDASTDGRNFAVAGGVAQAVVNVIKRDHPDQEVKVANAEGLKECRQLLKLATLGKYPGYLLEGMACPEVVLPVLEPCRQLRNHRLLSDCMQNSLLIKHQVKLSISRSLTSL